MVTKKKIKDFDYNDRWFYNYHISRELIPYKKTLKHEKKRFYLSLEKVLINIKKKLKPIFFLFS